MEKKDNRRSFLKKLTIGGVGVSVMPSSLLGHSTLQEQPAQENDGAVKKRKPEKRKYNGPYTGDYLRRIAFPVGGIGAGMFCLEGTGAISHMSVRHKPEIFHEPGMFAAIHIKGLPKGTKVLEGPVPDWKKFGQPGSGNGSAGALYGLPRFNEAEMTARFPFCHISLKDTDIPLEVQLTGWSPFIPTDEDSSSLPLGVLEYRFVNKGKETLEAVFSYNSRNFMAQHEGVDAIKKMKNGFVLSQEGTEKKPHLQGDFAVFTEDPATVIDYCWFRGGWWDPLTMAWNNIRDGEMQAVDPVDKEAPGASLYVPFRLQPGAEKTVRVLMAWHVPASDLHIGKDGDGKSCCTSATDCCSDTVEEDHRFFHYKPWYSSRFSNIEEVAAYWREHYDDLHKRSRLFEEAFYASTLPPEVTEAVAANLTILKSPTVMRQYDGRLWCFEGCGDNGGCCHGSCTHVWNYAQAVPHLFPSLERSLRHTEFCEDQDETGHQMFRADLPIRPVKHDFYAAADGQLGGIMKMYREWHISGDDEWLRKMYPLVKCSMDYCIRTWDPRHKGVPEEPHHNTYDIEFWGADGMCGSFYLGALKAMTAMGKFMNDDTSLYETLYDSGKKYMESALFNGEYFIQHIQYKGLNAADPVKASEHSFSGNYSKEALHLLQEEGPKYQYGTGCLSDGVLGAWIAAMCGLEDPLDRSKTESHLLSVHRYNLKDDLSDHANPQRPSYALGHEGGLLLCTWPKGGKLSLPFVYSDEVWTGIEYQVASHLAFMGRTEEALEIVRTCRDRYDGRTRNPFNEYECGSWYARAMSSYGLLQAFTGVRYDAREKTLYINSKIGDFTAFLSTQSGFGTVSLQNGKPSLQTDYGRIPVEKTVVAGREVTLAAVAAAGS